MWAGCDEAQVNHGFTLRVCQSNLEGLLVPYECNRTIKIITLGHGSLARSEENLFGSKPVIHLL